MTIDSNWLKAFKQEVPQAFTTRVPFVPQAVFIDGQIKLNPPMLTETQTWDMYINRQFKRSIDKYFSNTETKCVILAFDNYELVPSAKSMTQIKRRKDIEYMDFHPRDTLPPTVPKGQDWLSHLANRTFKLKMIQMIIYYLITHVKMHEDQFLIIDWIGHPKRYNHEKQWDLLSDIDPLGEADVKFCRYTKLFSKLQVDSVDGDSVPIALLHIQNTHQDSDFRISILRMSTNVGDGKLDKAPAKTPDKTTGKRKQTAAAATGTPSKSKREYEYLDVNLLYLILVRDVFPQCVDRAIISGIRGKEINLLIGLIGLTGTDYTRKISGVTATTLYDFLPLLWNKLSQSFDDTQNQFDENKMLNLVVGSIYAKKYEKHISDKLQNTAIRNSLPGILSVLSNSPLCARSKNSLQSCDVMRCTVRNTNWLLLYWTHSTYPDPVQDRFGFTVDTKRRIKFLW
jgi:hypothetical protein